MMLLYQLPYLVENIEVGLTIIHENQMGLIYNLKTPCQRCTIVFRILATLICLHSSLWLPSQVEILVEPS